MDRKIRPYCLGLAAYLKSQIREKISTANLTIPIDTEQSGFMTTFTIPNVNHSKVANYLWQDYQIESASVQAGSMPVLRVSTHFYNSYDDIDKFVSALVNILNTRPDTKD